MVEEVELVHATPNYASGNEPTVPLKDIVPVRQTDERHSPLKTQEVGLPTALY